MPLPRGKVMTVELWFGNSPVMIAEEFPTSASSRRCRWAANGALHLTTDDVDALWQRAIDAGAEVFHPLGRHVLGERFGQIIDPFGHRRGMATHLRDVPAYEVARAAAEMFAG